MYIAPGNTLETKFEDRKTFSHMLQVSKWSLRNLDLIHIFNDFMPVYSPGARAYNRLGQTFDVNRKPLWLCPFIASLKKKKKLILYTFSMILYMYIAPGQGQTTPLWFRRKRFLNGRTTELKMIIVTLFKEKAQLDKSSLSWGSQIVPKNWKSQLLGQVVEFDCFGS